MLAFRCQLFILLFIRLSVAYEEKLCLIELTNDPSLWPLLERSFGSHTILKPNTLLQMIKGIYGKEDETIILHCADGFSSPSRLANRVSVQLTCKSNRYWQDENGYEYSNNNNYYNEYEQNFKCKKLGWNLYESSEAFHWCPENTASYIIAKKNINKSPTHVAGLCYDTQKLLLSSIIYNMPTNQFNIVKTKFDFKNYTFGAEITNFPNIEYEGLVPLLFKDKQFQDWFTFGNFDYAPLIRTEDVNLKNITENFGSLLNITWWPNLRLGNWKRYKHALEKHTNQIKFDYNVITGIGGKLEVPISNDCDNRTEMNVLLDNYDRFIPAYIWNYLEPLQNTNKEFVIIAFNSPFYEFYSKNDIVFCEDICHEIDWLANVRSTFQYASMGITFCCRVDEVQKSKRLHNFPNASLNNYIENVTHSPSP
uniref:DNA/RNA non-specific endonuclease domain-containing protein n=1 Tax=Glossina brevipalpis TaxID=37001 RepID=A0A1A9WWD9_9MUSC